MKRKNTIAILTLAILIFFSIYLLQTDTVRKPADSGDAVITIDRGPCYGICPVYSLVIYGDGTITYDGKKFVNMAGKQYAKISPESVDELVNEFYAIQYFSLKDSYDEYIFTDMETITTSIKISGITKTIQHYRGDRNAPRELTLLENRIDEVAGSARWVK